MATALSLQALPTRSGRFDLHATWLQVRPVVASCTRVPCENQCTRGFESILMYQARVDDLAYLYR